MKKQTLIEKLTEAVEKYGMHIAGEGTMKASGNRFYLVTSRDYAKTNRMYIVEHHDGTHTCNCPAQKPCVHIALVAKHLNASRLAGLSAEALQEQQAEAERLAQLPKTLAQVETSEADKMAEAYTARMASNKEMYAQERREAGDICTLCGGVLDWQRICHEGICGLYGKKQVDTLCEMCQEAPAVHFDEQPRCDACQKLTERFDAGHTNANMWSKAIQAERAAHREAAILHTDNRAFSLYASE